MNWNRRYARERKWVQVDPAPASQLGQTCDHVSCTKTLGEDQQVTRINFSEPEVSPAYVHQGCVGNFLDKVDSTALSLQTGLGKKGANTATPKVLPPLHLKDPDLHHE